MAFPICLSVYGDTHSVCEYLQKYNEADLFEIRLDLSRAELDLERIRAATSIPLIFASHTKPELLQKAIPFANYLDVGSQHLSAADRDASPSVQIVSFHGKEEDPGSLWNTLNSDSITKIVLETADYKKIAQLLILNQTHPGKGICFAMGEIGSFSRILSVLKGAPWIYASLPEQPTASGQFTIADLVNIYRVKRFSSDPDVFGILGNQVSHSRSPEFHNRKFAENNLPWIYLPFPCTDLDSLMTHSHKFQIKGLSVTHPYKEEIIPYLKSKSKEVELLRSCNTLYRNDDGWHGINTDVDGLEELLRKNGIKLHGLRVVILGAGGAARAAAYVVKQHGGELIFMNRTHSKAEALTVKFGGKAIPLTKFSTVEYDVLIQTTTAGTHDSESPVNPDEVHPETTVIDVLYEPRESLLLKKARGLGCRTLNGEDWFIGQAEAQFKWWMQYAEG